MDIPWNDIRLFLAVAETGSFSGAARALNIGQPTVSRRIALLEASLGQALFARGVEGAQLTGAGERLVPAARRMAEQAGELARLSSAHEQTPEGTVRIAAPPGVAWDFVTPFARSLRGRLPHIRIEVLASIAYVDLVRGDADLALRLRAPRQRELTSLAALEEPVGVYASPGYAATLPAGYGMADVGWVTWAPPYHTLPPRPQLEAMIPNFRPTFTSDSFLVQWRAVEEGLGAIMLGRSFHPFARKRQLQLLELDLGGLTSTTYLVCAKTALHSARVRLVAEALVEEINRVEVQPREGPAGGVG